MGWQETLDAIAEEEVEVLLMEPRERWDPCVVGIVSRIGQQPFVVYSRAKVIESLCTEASYEDAVEHLDFNMAGGWVGPGTWGWLLDTEEG